MSNIHNIFSSLGITTEETDIYLLMLSCAPMPASHLAKKLKVARSSLYGILDRLSQKGLVLETQKNGVKMFCAENTEKILKDLNNKISSPQIQHVAFKELLPTLNKRAFSGKPPRLKYFENTDSLARALNEMLLYENIETYSVWPQKQMVKILGKDFFWHHNKERIKNNTSVKAIWPKSQSVDVKSHPYFGSGSLFKREIRIIDSTDFSLGYWIYNQTVIFISSDQENFGFVVESQELCETLKAQFCFVWKEAATLQTNIEDSRIFLDTLKV